VTECVPACTQRMEGLTTACELPAGRAAALAALPSRRTWIHQSCGVLGVQPDH
jgi:hypothetical protein